MRGIGVAFAAVLLLLGLTLPIYWVYLLSTVAVGALIARGIGVVTNRAGLIVLCQMSFAAIGGWVVSWLALEVPGWPFPLLVLLGGVAAAPVGLLLGLATARIRGVELAVVTLGLAAALDLVLRQGAFPGVGSGTPVVPSAPFHDPRWFFALAWATLLLLQLGVAALGRTSYGLGWAAIRSSDRTAAALGVRVTRAKAGAFGVGALFAGLAGGLLAGQYGLLTPDVFTPLTSMVHLATAVLCGAGLFAGAVLSGIFAVFVPELLRRIGLPLDVANALLALGAFDVLRRGSGGIAEQLRDRLQDRAFRGARLGCELGARPAELGARPAEVGVGDAASGSAAAGGGAVAPDPGLCGGRTPSGEHLVRRSTGSNLGQTDALGQLEYFDPEHARRCGSREEARSARAEEAVGGGESRLGGPRAVFAPGRASTQPPRLEVAGLTVDLGNVRVLDAVDLAVVAGEVHALIGPNGAGKSTLVDAVTGFLPGYGGAIRLDGESVEDRSARERARLGLRRTFQHARAIEALTVDEYLRLAVGAAGAANAVDASRASGFAALAPRERAAAVAEFLGLPGGSVPIRLMDAGSRRVLEIAGALVAAPCALLLDEPAAGLGDAESLALAERVRRIPAEFGCAVLLIEHDMGFVRAAASRTTVLDSGRVIACGSTAAVLEEPRVRAAYLGREVPAR